MQVTHDWTERPHGALLQLGIDLGQEVYRIGGRLRSCYASSNGVNVGIPPSCCLGSNLRSNEPEDSARWAV